MRDLQAFALWYAALAAVGLAALPLARRLLAPLGLAAGAAARALGLLLAALVWRAGNALDLLARERRDAALALAAVAVAGLVLRVRRTQLPRPRRLAAGLRTALPGEVLFFVLLAAAAFLRAGDPAARQTERPMDLMLLNAVAEAPAFPIGDPWLAGERLAYYDQGHWQVALLARLSGVSAERAVNLGVASSWALLALGGAGIGTALARRSAALRRRRGLVAATALLSGGAVALAGNLAGARAALERWGLLAASPAEAPWWWGAGRAIVDRTAAGEPFAQITEFPFFSLVVGDLHAHLLAAPMGLLVAAVALAELLARRASWPRLIGGGLLAVSPLLANPWELPGSLLLWLIAVWLGSRRRRAGGSRSFLRRDRREPLDRSGEGLAPALRPRREGDRLSAPSLRGLRAPSGAKSERPPSGWVAIGAALGWGALLWALGGASPAAVSGLRPNLASWTSPREWLLVHGSLLPGLMLLAALAFRPGALAPGERGALLLGAAGAGLVVIPEILFVADAFGQRMNTLFKLHYQAWPLLAVASALGLARAFASRRRGARLAALAGFAALGAGLLYPAALIAESAAVRERSLDALAFLARESPDEAAALAWIRSEVPRGALVLQGRGESYRPERSWVSIATGVPPWDDSTSSMMVSYTSG